MAERSQNHSPWQPLLSLPPSHKDRPHSKKICQKQLFKYDKLKERFKSMRQEACQALKWTVKIFEENNISFRVCGGLAARIHGSQRILKDIDIEIRDKDFDKLLPAVKEHIIFGPERFNDAFFDVLLLRLNYKNQIIDISGCSTEKIYNEKTKKWIENCSDIDDCVKKKICRIKIPVIPKEELIEYKEINPRKEDLKDINDIKEANNK